MHRISGGIYSHCPRRGPAAEGPQRVKGKIRGRNGREEKESSRFPREPERRLNGYALKFHLAFSARVLGGPGEN